MAQNTARLSTALADRYKIERHLGEGGMATVYLAEDLKHKRKVAVKVLRPELAAVLGADRFVQEITTTANLQHPHILPLFDSGEADSFLYYVMPFIDGETLRDKLNRETQLGIDEAVNITTAIADALDYAHRNNVIHRDIKPENILLHDGRPMVADFGIALAVSAAAGGRMTETGLSLGTPHYMSPEQATAEKDLTNRSDIYSLGSVLYEMLTGEPPHMGNSAQQIIMKIVTDTPRPVTELRKSVPPHVAASTAKALEKLAADRFDTAAHFAEALGDARLAPVTVTTTTETGPEGARRPTPRWRAALPWGLLAATMATLLIQWTDRGPTGLVETVRFVERLPTSVEGGMEMGIALANDGRRLFIPLVAGGWLVRDLAEADGKVLSLGGTVPGFSFLSPGGKWIAFHDGGEQQLQRVSTDGGVPIPIADGVPGVFGGSWGSDDTTIVYAPGISGGLWTVTVGGRTPEQITVPDQTAGELGHWYPQILPGGEKVLFSTYRTPVDSSAIEVVDLDTKQRDIIFQGGQHGRYVPTGHIVYMRRETMWAVPFDLRRMKVTGPGEPVLDDVAYNTSNAVGAYAIAGNGTLAYIKASDWNVEGRLVWVDRGGTERPALDEWGVYSQPRISPDGGRVAYVRTQGGERDIWVADLALGAVPTRVTRNDGIVASPLWTRGGMDIIYSKDRPQFDLFKRDWRASAQAEELSTSQLDKLAQSISPDGLELAYWVNADSWDIWILQLAGPPEPREFRVTEYNEFHPNFSPDGRWLAYVSDETGQDEIWLESYPDAARGRRQISREGGILPRWVSGSELFYRHDSQIMAVRIELASGSPGIPSVALDGLRLQSGVGVYDYDVFPDGQRFLVIKPRPGVEQRRQVTVVLNWFEELREKMGN